MNRSTPYSSLSLTLTALIISAFIANASPFISTANAQIVGHQKISNLEGGFTATLENNDQFGWVVTNIGDLDGDGVNDLATGVPGDDDGAAGAGCIYILFLNADGSVKNHQKISATEGGFTGVLDEGDQFAHSMAPIGDFDGDGVIDLAVGSLYDDDGGPDRGAFYIIYLNIDGTVKAHQKISDTEGGFTDLLQDDDGFGHGIVRIGDLNGDGVDDLAAATGHIEHEGILWILFMNTDGTVNSFQRIAEGEGGFMGDLDPGDELGHDTEALGDLDGDGVLDIIAGSPGDDDGGVDHGGAYILFLNTDGTVKKQQKISDLEGGFTGDLDEGDKFGHPPANVGDLDGDGVVDLLFGAPFDDDGDLDAGGGWVLFMNSDGTVKAHQKISKTQGGFTGDIGTGDLFSHIVTSMGDINGDGGVDFAVSAPHDDDGGNDRGAIWILFSDYDVEPDIPPKEDGAFLEVDGMVVIEAENYFTRIDRGNHMWVESTDQPGYSGTSAMLADPNDQTRYRKNQVAESPELNYSVEFSTSGSYIVWVRAYAPSVKDNRLHMGINDFPSASKMETPIFKQWAWTNVNAKGNIVSQGITTPGAASLQLWMSEDGIYVDKFLLTTDAGFVPEGEGPPESPRATASIASKSTGSKLENTDFPTGFALEGNHPNPFNPSTTIRFVLSEQAPVRLIVYDMLGREVERLMEGVKGAGNHEVTFNANGLPSGTYLYRLETPAHSVVRRMVLLK